MLKYSDWRILKYLVFFFGKILFHFTVSGHCDALCLTCSKPGTYCLQLAAFRSLRYYKRGAERPCDEVNGLIINNYRPPLPLGNREVTEYNHSDYTNLELVKMHLCELF